MKTRIGFVTILLLLFFTTTAECQINYRSNKQVGKYANVNDMKVYYETYGAGKPPLLLHGGMWLICSIIIAGFFTRKKTTIPETQQRAIKGLDEILECLFTFLFNRYHAMYPSDPN